MISHSVMFHYFHNEFHPKAQGSLSGTQFKEIIHFLSKKYHLINANEYLLKYKKGTLNGDDICLSFDDALKCQFEIVFPILKDFKISAFFFINSSPMCGKPNYLEMHRLFRTTKFANIDDFYEIFFHKLESKYSSKYEFWLHKFHECNYLSQFLFYSTNDRLFRFFRDVALKEEYITFMKDLMIENDFSEKDACKELWMSNEDVVSLSNSDQIIGLHSYTHPTMIHMLSYEEQEAEYVKNHEHLKTILGFAPESMSHPCGRYSNDIFPVLKRLGIKIGFRSDMGYKATSDFELPRQDSSNVLHEMKGSFI